MAGLVNGVLVTRLGLSSLVVTLGTMALFRGLGYVILGPASVNVLPDALTDFGINTLGPILPWTMIPFLVLAPLFVIVLHFTPTGRRIYAIGGNPDAARYSGVNGRRIRLTLFVVSGLVSAVAGIVFTARLSNARADNAVGFELDVITVALLGGINVFGGRGNYAGVFCALALDRHAEKRARPQPDRRGRARNRHRAAAHRVAARQQCRAARSWRRSSGATP